MFTGLITEVGAVSGVEARGETLHLMISAPRTSRHLQRGDSVAVSGVCLTAVKIHRGNGFGADLAAETVARSSLAELRRGARVNLELPMRAGQPLGGHIVQGHVDGVGRFLSLVPAAEKSETPRGRAGGSRNAQDYWLRLRLPKRLGRYVVEKGSIAVEGISLTVAKVRGPEVTIAVIPHTYAATNLPFLKRSAPLNIEVDVLAKYAERQAIPAKSSALTVARLRAEGF